MHGTDPPEGVDREVAEVVSVALRDRVPVEVPVGVLDIVGEANTGVLTCEDVGRPLLEYGARAGPPHPSRELDGGSGPPRLLGSVPEGDVVGQPGDSEWASDRGECPSLSMPNRNLLTRYAVSCEFSGQNVAGCET